MTFDVEEWFQVENFKEWIAYGSWPFCQSRVEESTHRILDLLDGCSSQRKTDSDSNASRIDKAIRATFFILGWIAEQHPNLVREIHSRGHEVASHGYNHELSGNQDRASLREDIRRSKQLLEDLIGEPVLGYRAPSFSVTTELLDVLSELDFHYDSSYNSFGMNQRYGHLDLRNLPRKEIALRLPSGLFEVPVSNWRLAGKTIPLGGGGYFRLFPLPLWRTGMKAILREQNAYLMYLHPWEFDPEQPMVAEATTIRKFRHYLNLSQTNSRLKSLIRCFSRSDFLSCKDYLCIQ